MKKAMSTKVKVYKKWKNVSNYKKYTNTIAYLQKLRYKLPAFSSVKQCRSMERIFLNNIDSFEFDYQNTKIFIAFRFGAYIKKVMPYQSIVQSKALKLRLKDNQINISKSIFLTLFWIPITNIFETFTLHNCKTPGKKQQKMIIKHKKRVRWGGKYRNSPAFRSGKTFLIIVASCISSWVIFQCEQKLTAYCYRSWHLFSCFPCVFL